MNPIHMLMHCPPGQNCFAMLDGAAHPAAMRGLLAMVGSKAHALFGGVAAETLQDAGAFLVPLQDSTASRGDLVRAEVLDSTSPWLTVISSRLSASALALHLRQFLYADIGEGMRALLRFYDPRVMPAALRAWPGSVTECLLAPVDQWLFRGHHEAWQAIVGGG